MKLFNKSITHLMKSISTRLAIWYALAATTTLACLFVAGYLLLQQHLIHGLDQLNEAELGQIKGHVFRDYDPQDPGFVERRMRKSSDRTAALYFVEIRNTQTGAIFRSNNLKDRALTGPPNEQIFNVDLNGIGELRVARFKIEPLLITIGTPLTDVRNLMEGYSEICLMLLGAMMVASIAIGFSLSRLALTPIRLISNTADRIRSDNLNERIPVTDVQDEVSDLARMLNQTFDRLESSFNQIRRFAAEASHELKTPLSLVRLHAEKMLADGNLSPAQEEAVHVQLEELTRLGQIIEELLFLSRADAHAITLDLQPMNPARFLQTLAQDAKVLTEHQGQRFAYTHDGEGRVAFDDKRMRQVLLNLLTNALNVSPPGGRITLRSLLADNMWRLSVEDEGPGLPSEQLERIFERFVRITVPGKEYKGSGLGLAICRSIVGLHQGRIFATTGTGGSGLHVVIEIPVTN